MAQVDWQKALALEHKVAAIVAEQVRTGWEFNTDKAKGLVEMLDTEMARLDSEIRPLLKQYPTAKGSTVAKPFKKDGTFTVSVQEWINEHYGATDCTGLISGPFTRINWNELSLTQRDKLMGQLMAMGWQPTSYTDKGAPQLTPNKEPCPNLAKIPGDLGPKLSQYFLSAHRRGQIQGWIDNVRSDGRIEAQVRPNATNTGRGAHRIVANVPKAEDSVFLGKEMRSLFIAAPGKVLVGCDAAGLELRMLAHFMNDPEFTHELLEGDIHTTLWNEVKDLVPSRSVNKNCTYGLIYGASDRKLGETAGHGPNASHVGLLIRERWMSRFPTLGSLIERAQKASRRGYLIGLDGRKIWMRKNPKNNKVMEHKALNTLLQFTGSLVMKVAMVYHSKWDREQGLDSRQVAWVHDEWQKEVSPEHAEQAGENMRRSIIQTGKFLKMNCPLDGEYKVSDNWSGTH